MAKIFQEMAKAFFKFCLSGEISPKLVTLSLVLSAVPHCILEADFD